MVLFSKSFHVHKKRSLFLLFWLIGLISNGQSLIKGKVIDNHHKPIPYASIGYFNNKIGTISDSLGDFFIKKILGDSLKVSFIGLQSKVIIIDSNIGLLNIQLDPRSTSLSAVVIANRKKTKNTITLGHFIKEKKTTYSAKLHQDLHRAIYIPNTKKIEGYIDEIIFQLFDYKNKRGKLRIRVFSVDSITGLPDEDLLLSDNIIEANRFKRINKFSIKSHNIQMDKNGIWVSFEWLPIDVKLTNEDIPEIDGNNKAERPFMMDNWKEIKWKPVYDKSNKEGYFVPNVSVIVSF